MRFANAAETERVVSIVGADEVDLNRNQQTVAVSVSGCPAR